MSFKPPSLWYFVTAAPGNWVCVHTHIYDFFILKFDLQYCVRFRYTAEWFTYTYMYIYIFQIFFWYRLLQHIEYNSLCYTVNPCCLSNSWRPGFDPWVGKIPWRRKWKPTPVFLPGKSHGLRILVGYSPWGHKESDTSERLHSVYIH